jgi:hypothetical protein
MFVQIWVYYICLILDLWNNIDGYYSANVRIVHATQLMVKDESNAIANSIVV